MILRLSLPQSCCRWPVGVDGGEVGDRWRIMKEDDTHTVDIVR